MEFNSQLELYHTLLPVFNVKRRLLSISNPNIRNEDIWKYLAKNKWPYASNLTIADITNDIIILDINELTKGELS